MTNSQENQPASRPAYLVFEFERRAYQVGPETFTIGRASSCDIVIREPSVSRVHAELLRTQEGVHCKAIGATPTVVNGAPVVGELLLHHGDEIDIGSAKLTFTELALPLGVSIVEKARKKPVADVADRRATITNPILQGHANPNQGPAKQLFRPIVLMLILAVVVAYYFGAAMR